MERLRNKIQLVYDNFVTSGIQVTDLNSHTFRKVQLINLLSAWLTIAAMTIYLILHNLSYDYLQYLGFVSILVSLFNLFLLRATHRINLCAHIVILNLFLVIFIGNIYAGGPMTPGVLWFAVIPVTAAVISTTRSLFFYMFLTSLMAITLYILYLKGLIPLYPFHRSQKLTVYLFFSLTTILVISAALYHLLQEKMQFESFLEQRYQRLQHKTKKYHFIAHSDELTNLGNRTSFNNAIKELSNYNLNSEEYLTIFYIDIDRLKIINDTYGHLIGDKVLYFMAQRIQSCFRKNDIVARIGGDEFAAIIIEKNDAITAEKIAHRLKEICMSNIVINQISIKVTLSIGIARYPQDGNSLAEVTNNADKAMYSVKQAGRNDYAFYEKNIKA